MYHVEVVPEMKLPYDTLTYKSDINLVPGQLVEIPVRNKVVWGMVHSLRPAPQSASNIETIKSIKREFPYSINKNRQTFLKQFSYNTFNQLSVSLQSYLNPIQAIGVRSLKKLFDGSIETSLKNNEKNDVSAFTVDYQLFTDITLRIMDIIRTIVYTKGSQDPDSNTNSVILVIFPEKKMMQKYYTQINERFTDESDLLSHIYTYTGAKDAQSLNTTRDLLFEPQTPKIIFAQRSGIFLPFEKLNTVILIDEANSMYIQDQNNLYYDAREAVYLLAMAFQTSLLFISEVPSVRLHTFYSDKLLEQRLSNKSSEIQSPLKIDYMSSASDFADSNLLSHQVYERLDALTGKDGDITLSFENPEE